MKVTFKKEELLLAITKSLGCVSTEKTINSIEGILITTIGDSQCQLCAYDLEKGIKIIISAEVESGGVIVMNGNKLSSRKNYESLLRCTNCAEHSNHILGLVLSCGDVVNNDHLVCCNLRGECGEHSCSLGLLVKLDAVASGLRTKCDTAVCPLRRTGGTLSCMTGCVFVYLPNLLFCPS